MVRAYQPLRFANSYSLFAKRTSSRALVVLPSPHSICTTVYDCTCILFDLLLLSGHVESNPGPLSSTENCELLATLLQLQSWQSAVLDQLKSIQVSVSDQERRFLELNSILVKIETECTTLVATKADIDTLRSTTTACMAHVSALTARAEDADNRSRRCNLVFYGRKDCPNENWRESEKLIIDHCIQHLQSPIEPREIERVNRLGWNLSSGQVKTSNC